MTIEYLRQFKIGGYAIFDLSVAFLGVYLLSPLLTKLFRLFKLEVPRKSWLLLTLPASILIHLAIGNMTRMTRDFLDTQGHISIKILLVVLLLLSLEGMKKLHKNSK